MAYRATPHGTTGYSPLFVLHGREMVLPNSQDVRVKLTPDVRETEYAPRLENLKSTLKSAYKLFRTTNCSNWETLASHGKLSSIWSFLKAYPGERARRAISDGLHRPHYLSMVDHERNIRSRRQRTDIGKYSIVNRTIKDWKHLPAEVLGTLPCEINTLKRRVRKAFIEVS